MKFADITREFTKTVNGYINKGYIFSSSMHGNQGEIMRADLTDGKETVRVSITSGISKLTLSVESFNKSCNDAHHFSVLWNGDGSKVMDKCFYLIRNDVYTEDKDFRKHIEDKQMQRAFNVWTSDTKLFTSDEAKSAVLPFVRRQYRCKTKTVNDIDCIEKNLCTNQYTVKLVNGKAFRLS